MDDSWREGKFVVYANTRLLFIFSNKFEKFGHFNPRATSKCLSVRLAYLLLLKRFNGQVIILIYWLLSLAASPRPRCHDHPTHRRQIICQPSLARANWLTWECTILLQRLFYYIIDICYVAYTHTFTSLLMRFFLPTLFRWRTSLWKCFDTGPTIFCRRGYVFRVNEYLETTI